MASLTRKRSTPTRTSASSANNDSVLFTIGRMNPPTPGHKKLIQTMIVEALRKTDSVVFVNLTSTVGSNTEGKINPLQCKDKKRIVQKMIEQIKIELVGSEYDPADIEALQVIVNCADDKDIKHPSRPNQIPDLLIGMFNKLSKIGSYNQKMTNGLVNFRLYLGEKDYGKFDWLKNTYPFYDKTSKTQYDLESIKVSRPPGDMSATYLRNLTIRDDDKFLEAMKALAEEQGKDLTTKDIKGLKNLDRQSAFIQEMMKVGLDEDEASKLFDTIQSEIERYQREALLVQKATKTTTTRKKKGGKRSNGHKRRTKKHVKKSKGRT